MPKNAMDPGKTKFLADAMLGKLAKWLRVLGYDTVYRSRYRAGEMDDLLGDERCLLSRQWKTVHRHQNAVFVRADRVGSQLMELKEKAGLQPEPAKWFCRCLICNAPLEKARSPEMIDRVPEYIYYNRLEIRFCPSCGRHYWPGTHKDRMISQLRQWGFG